MANKRIRNLTEVDTPTGGFFIIDIGASEERKISAENILGATPSLNIVGATFETSTLNFLFILSDVNEYTLPLLSSLSSLNFTIQIKNLSGGDCTVVTSGADTFDTGTIAQTSITIPYGYTLSLFAYSTGYLITNNV